MANVAPNIVQTTTPYSTGGLLNKALQKNTPVSNSAFSMGNQTPTFNLSGGGQQSFNNPVSHPGGTPKSSIITTKGAMGDTTTHQINYDTSGGNTGSTQNPNAGLISQVQSQLATAKQQLADAQAAKAAGYVDGETPQKDAQGNIVPKNTTFPGSTANLANTSGTAADTGNKNINTGTDTLINPATNPQEPTAGYQSTLGNISQNQTPAVTNAQNEYNTFSKASPMLLADVANNPNVAAEVSVGRGAQLGQTLAGEQAALGQNVANALQGQGQQITAANEAGGLANTAQGQGITAGSNILSGGLTGQGQGIQGQGAVVGAVAPQGYGLTTQPYNPISDTYGGGGSGGAINRSIQAGNIGSASDLTQKINQTQSIASGADANFSVLNSYAQGFAGDTPILNGIQQKYGTTLQGNQAVAGFQAQLQNVRSAYSALFPGSDPTQTIPDNITPNQLTQVQQAIKTASTNAVAGYQSQLDKLKGSGSSNNSSSNSSTFGGSAWN